MTDGHTLVLGGGGVAGVAWLTGVLAGLAATGYDITGADVIIGTSAGAVVAAQVTSGLALADLYARQADLALQTAELEAHVDLAQFGAEIAAFLVGAVTSEEASRRVGQYALEAQTVPESTRRAVIEARLPSHDWPARSIRLTAVDARTGILRVFDAGSAVPLVDAVAASCAVPGIWPPVTIDGARYVDGGVRSSDNADLAAGAERIIVVSPLGYDAQLPSPMPLRDVVAKLRDAGSEVTVVCPDAASRAAIGANPLDPATRISAAQAGRSQGLAGLAANAANAAS